MTRALYTIGRLLMLLGMFELLVDIVTASEMGPNPKLFYLGIVIFLAGWGLTRATKSS
jgi:hypothetical protein